MNIETIALVIAFATALYAVVYGAYDLMHENQK